MSICLDGSCKGACCVGDIEVLPTDTIACFDNMVKDGKMITINNKCKALMPDGLCSIYSVRPDICKRFPVGGECCLMLRSGKRDKHVCERCVLHEL